MANLLAPLLCLIGQWLESRGMESVAIGCYQLAGSRGGKHGAKALWRAGNILFACGQLPDALATYQASVQLDPTNANAWCDLGIACREEGQFDEARRCYERALEIAPTNVLALTRIGELLLAQGDPVVALIWLERVLEQAPMFYEALGYRIAALAECDRLAEAEQAARQAIEHYPESAKLLIKLGSVLVRSGKTRLGMIVYTQALEIEPDNQEARFNLAIAQDNSQALAGAIEFIRQKIKREGESAHLQGLLAMALHHSGEVAEAETVCRKLLAQHPSHAPGWQALSGIAKTQGDVGKTIECLNKVLELKPDASNVFSDALFMSTYLPDPTDEAVFKRHLEWAERYETPLQEKRFLHVPEDKARHRLKIGYLSGDLRSHPVGLLLRGVLEQHDRDKFEIHCFATSYKAHPLTEILHRLSDSWHEVQLLSAEELAALIHAQGIDILVDLSGHTAENRLKVLALKPAPVQATWIGYFHSTGLASIDYFITDPHTTPPESQQFFSEFPVRLPHSRFCYTPHWFAPEVSVPPADKAGHVMFGSFNRLPKLTDQVIEAWSRIVLNVPDARLMIKADGLNDAATVERITTKFETHGLSPERLVLRPRSDHRKLLEEISEADIALDPFPFNGGMTTMDSLWMGVPVVALAGNSVVSRQSASVLANLGLEELIFPDVESYIAGAVALALDTSRLASLRSIIRPRMSRSTLCDAEQFTSDLEMLYQRMWQAWCRGTKLGSEIVPGIPVARKIAGSMSCSRTDSGHLLELFQKQWRDNSSSSSSDVSSGNPAETQEKIEIISATRLSESDFWNKSALGISLRRLEKDPRLVARIAFENKRSQPDVFNERIASTDEHDILVFIHDDVWIDDYFFADHVLEGLKTFDVIGVAGNRRRLPNQPAWALIDNDLTKDSPTNLSGRIAHDSLPFGTISVYGKAPAECELLDGVFLAARKSSLSAAKVQFDPRFDFHFYDMDFCRSARKSGLRLGTWPICLTHQNSEAFGGPQWDEKYRLYLEKWNE